MSRRKRLLIAVLVLSLPTLTAVARASRVAGSSDVPAFLDGDLVLVNHAAYGLRLPFREEPLSRWAKPARGDVVLFRLPGGRGVAFKTVIGLPGERFEVHDGRVTINGDVLRYSEIVPDLLPREAVKALPEGTLAREQRYELDHLVVVSATAEHFGPMEIPENHYFLLGSNRARSVDSRHFGPVSGSEIRGEVYLNLSSLWRR